MHVLPGACLCGAVRYEVEGPLGEPRHCHCSRCRKHHGAPFATSVSVAPSAFRWLAGVDSLCEFASSPGCVRRFCKTCGSVAPTLMGDNMRVPLGNLSGQFEVSGGLHQFVRSKAPWHVIADALPQYDAEPPGAPPPAPRAELPSLEGATRGSCLCGKVAFSVSGAPMRWLQCHCSRCRRGRSAAHGSNAFYPEERFAWQTGSELVQQYRPPDAPRFAVSFCARCGGGAPVVRDKVPFVLVPAGLLDDDPGARPEGHIHVTSKASWYAISDDLPQFGELPPSA